MNSRDILTIKGLQAKDLEEAKIEEKELIKIVEDYNSIVKNLENQANYFSNILHMCKDINSVKWRTKDPVHLLIKIVRKRKEAIERGDESSKYMNINSDNYRCIVNDLIGLRAIYLFKAQWSLIDEYIFKNFKVCADEDVIIYYAEDDDISHYPDNERFKNLEEEYTKKINDVEYSYRLDCKSSRYRSTHYIIEGLPPQSLKFELQTRTILEEAWGEIDHYIRYPEYEDDSELIRRMSILNGALSSCEEHSTTFYSYYREMEISKTEILIESSDEQANNSYNNTENDLGLEAENENISSDDRDKVEKEYGSKWDRDIATIALNRKNDRLSELLSSTQSPVASLNREYIKALSSTGVVGSLPTNTLEKLKSTTDLFGTSNRVSESIMNSVLPNIGKLNSTLGLGMSDVLKNERQTLLGALKPFEESQKRFNDISRITNPLGEFNPSIVNRINHNNDDESSE